jgi:hypothetical protein
MARRQGPQLLRLIYAKAFEADDLMRPEAANPHQGQGHKRSRNRPDRFVHSKPPAPKDHLAREASIDRHKDAMGRAAKAWHFRRFEQSDGVPQCYKRTI